jgi:hypothetical protein
MTSEECRDRVYALIKRFNEIGASLPDPGTFDASDPAAKADAKLVLAELAKVKAEIDRLLAEATQ